MTWTVSAAATGVVRSAGWPATKTLMCGRSRGPSSTSRSRRPGDPRHRARRGPSPTSAPRHVMPAVDAGEQREQRARQQDGGHRWRRRQSMTTASTAQISGRSAVMRSQRRALVAALPQLTGLRPERDADRVERVAGHRLAQDAQVGVLLRQAIAVALPGVAAIGRPPDGGRGVRHVASPVVAVERDDPPRLRVAGMGDEREAELAGQPVLGQVGPRGVRRPSSDTCRSGSAGRASRAHRRRPRTCGRTGR